MISATVRGARTRIPKLLEGALDERLAGVSMAAANPVVEACLRAAASRAHESVVRLIKDAPNGSDIQVQVTADRDPVGGWSATVFVSVNPPATKAGKGTSR